METTNKSSAFSFNQAAETDGLEIELNKKQGILSAPMKTLVSHMPLQVVPEKADGVEGVLILHFTDSQVKEYLNVARVRRAGIGTVRLDFLG